jgi:hypothetical protein
MGGSLLGCEAAEATIELDEDQDGLMTSEEEELGTDPQNSDSDGDGASDSEELEYGTDPTDPTDGPQTDTDGDGYTDYDEIDAGMDHTDPNEHPYLGGYPLNRCDTDPGEGDNIIGSVAKDFALVDQFGETVTLSDFCGDVVILEVSQFG